MGSFNLEDYAPVQDRISEFYREFEQGSIRTRMAVREGPEVVFEARVYRTLEEADRGIFTSGWAHEVEGKSPVNRGSHVENCETSAIGRALANLAYTTSSRRPSRSEMLKVHQTRQDHEEALEDIRAVGAAAGDEDEFRIGGRVQNVKAYIRENWPALKEQYRLARTVAAALESLQDAPASAEPAGVTDAASEAAEAKLAAPVPLYVARPHLKLGGRGEFADLAIVDCPDDALMQARNALVEAGSTKPAHVEKLAAIQTELLKRDQAAAAMQDSGEQGSFIPAEGE